MDQTDRHNELVQKREWLVGGHEKRFELTVPAFAFEDAVSGKGSAFVRLGPLPHARADPTLPDFAVDVRVTRLRMEVLNPLRNQGLYAGDPLAPSAYPPETIFAITMPASPLGWFEVQNLAPETVAAWKPLVAAWKRERNAMAACNVIPVGAKPDGLSWTGFLFVPREKGGAGYALLFRELAENAQFACDFARVFPGMDAPEILSPRGTATKSGVTVEQPLDFVWAKFSAQ